MSKGVHRVGGIRTTCGVKEPKGDDLPTRAELRAWTAKMGLTKSSRRGRCGRPGRGEASAEYWERLRARLVAACKGGRGLRFLSRDELDAVMKRLESDGASQMEGGKGSAKPKPKKTRRRTLHWGLMP